MPEWQMKSNEESYKRTRFITWRDLIITPTVSAAIFTLAGLSTWWVHRTLSVGLVAMILVFFVAQSLLGVIAIRIVLSTRFPREGVFDFNARPQDCYRFKILNFLCTTHLWFEFSAGLLSPILRKPFFQLLGGRFGKGIIMISGRIHQPWLISLDEGAIVGQDSLVLPHAITAHELVLGRIEIGKGAIVGAKSVIMPGVRIGECAMVNAMSLVSANTVIGPYEMWGGIPAKKLRDLPRPSADPALPLERIREPKRARA
jgi:hypothetical protein